MNLPRKLVSELPPEALREIDPDEFAPDSEAARRLGERLGAHVVSYRPGADGRATGRPQLCRMLAGADLDPHQLRDLHQLEQDLGVTLVAYARPCILAD